MAHGAKADSSSATGSRITSLLRIDPSAIRPDDGQFAAAAKPWTYFGVTAASSITAPAALAPALVACPITSSTEAAATLAMAATSSSRARSPLMPCLHLSPTHSRPTPADNSGSAGQLPAERLPKAA
jgi:hypothetical protein